MKNIKTFIKKNKLFSALIVMAIIIALVAIFAPALAPYSPYDAELSNAFQAPSSEHLFGTDKLGRDVFSRILCGAKTSFGLTFLMLFLIVFIGMIVGLIAGLSNDKVESFFNNIINGLLAFPDTIFAIAIVGIVGAGLFNTVFALALIWWTKYARLTLALVKQEKKKNYLVMAKMSGVPTLQRIIRYLLPNILSQILVTAFLDIGNMMISLAGLSFLGLASQPPQPEWGAMLYESKQFMQVAPWMMFFPGLVLFICVLIFNLLSEDIRDYLDPKHYEEKL